MGEVALLEARLLEGVFAAEVFEVLDVLLIHLLEDTLQIFSARSLQVSVEFGFLFDAEEGLLVGEGQVVLWRQADLRLTLKHERDFLLSLALEVLLDGVLHRVDPFFETRVPIVLHCVIRATHQLL